MKRRHFLYSLGTVAAVACIPLKLVQAAASIGTSIYRRVRPADAAWPTAREWDRLRRQVGGRLIKVQSPLSVCADPSSTACSDFFELLKNPYYIGDEPGLTQALGWADAWICEPSAYAVACEKTEDVVAAIRFARKHKLRVVVKGGGHSYQGTSNSRDSLLIWTRKMNAITLHEAFVGAGCSGVHNAVPAVSVDAGAIWMHTYNAVTTHAGRYVQGGGCGTVGVAGLIQSGGFGSYSKKFGLAAASLIEAEIVTADGVVHTVNACSQPELFWAIKGGGGGSLGVITKVTLRTHELPATFGVVRMQIHASSDEAYRRLIAQLVAFYAAHLFNPVWGEQISVRPDNTLEINMSFQGLDQPQAVAVWQPFVDWLAQSPTDYALANPPLIIAVPARKLWDPEFLRTLPDVIRSDSRPGASKDNVYWSDNEKEAGKFLSGYQSVWLPASLLQGAQQQRLADTLFAASRHDGIELHCNKGLAGASSDVLAAAGDTAMNPAVLDAFALAICADEQLRVHPGIPGHQPDMVAAREEAGAIDRAMKALKAVIPNPGSYVSESNFFEENWQQSFWGKNYPRLLAVKHKYDPEGLFFVHHGVGSETWSADGFTRLS